MHSPLNLTHVLGLAPAYPELSCKHITAEQFKNPATARSNEFLRAWSIVAFAPPQCPTYQILANEFGRPRVAHR